LFPSINDQFTIFFFELTVAAGRLKAARRRLSRPLASRLLPAPLRRTMRDRSRGRITRLSVFGYHYWPPVENTIVVVGNHYGVEAGVVEREGPECDPRRLLQRLPPDRDAHASSPQSLFTEPGCEALPECAENRLLLKSGASWKSKN
jgi:hypothetical protein